MSGMIHDTGGGWEEAAERRDVIVLGAGVVGVATAYALARQGISVALVDRSDEPGRGCSFANGGQLSYAYTDALANPKLVARMPGLVLGRDPVFRIRLADPDMLHWGLRFLRQCTSSQFRRSTLEGLALASESRLALHDLLRRHPIAFDHAAPGKLHLLHSREALEAAKPLVELKQGAGIVQHVLDAAQVRSLEPALESAQGLAGAVHSPEEELGDPYLFAIGLTEVLRRDYGVTTHFGFDAAKVERKPDSVSLLTPDGRRVTGSQMVVALGPQARGFLQGLGISVPIMPMKGYSFTAPAGRHAPRLSITDAARKLVFCPFPGRIRIAGFAELGTRDPSVEPERLAELVASAQASLPDAAVYAEAGSGWAGLRPMTPSSLPIVKRAAGQIVLNVGHGMLGWTYAMATAERAARIVKDGLAEGKTIMRSEKIG